MANTAENSVRVDLERIGSSIRRIASVRFASTALVRLQTRNPAHLNGAVQAKRCPPDSALGICLSMQVSDVFNRRKLRTRSLAVQVSWI